MHIKVHADPGETIEQAMAKAKHFAGVLSPSGHWGVVLVSPDGGSTRVQPETPEETLARQSLYRREDR